MQALNLVLNLEMTQRAVNTPDVVFAGVSGQVMCDECGTVARQYGAEFDGTSARALEAQRIGVSMMVVGLLATRYRLIPGSCAQPAQLQPPRSEKAVHSLPRQFPPAYVPAPVRENHLLYPAPPA